MKKKELHIVNIEAKKVIAIKQLNNVINIFDSLCIDYWIEYGTLLGAVREGGCIPWDSEFDLGIWNLDFLQKKEKLFEKFKNAGFVIDLSSKDRIKLYVENQRIGAYYIDIHTYHIKDDIAYVSFNKKKKSLYVSLISSIYGMLKIYDFRVKKPYLLGAMKKYLLQHYNHIPEEFQIRSGKFNTTLSFTLICDKKEYNFEKMFFKNKRFSKIGILLSLIVPSNVRYYLVDTLKKRYEKLPVTNDIQSFPKNYFKKLNKIKFENLTLSCPSNYIDYVELVYGETWSKPMYSWQRTDNKINKKLT